MHKKILFTNRLKQYNTNTISVHFRTAKIYQSHSENPCSRPLPRCQISSFSRSHSLHPQISKVGPNQFHIRPIQNPPVYSLIAYPQKNPHLIAIDFDVFGAPFIHLTHYPECYQSTALNCLPDPKCPSQSRCAKSSQRNGKRVESSRSNTL